MKDEIIEELWKVKDEIAKEHNYDIDKLVETLREREKTEKRKIVDFSEEQKPYLTK
ncbi:MAG: hypothetical protein HQK84_07790 [Nitrospinae bacterium]|nr:hypothetical protein [Nitrospinota bacterium]